MTAFKPKFTLGGLAAKLPKIAALAKMAAPKRSPMPKPAGGPKPAPMPRIAHGGASTLHLKRLPLSKVKVQGGY